MQQLENKSESFDFNQELEADLAVVNDAQERMSRWFDINEKIDEMQGSKDVVDNVLSKLEDLVTLEGQLRFPSEYREVLNQNKRDLETYSKEMWRLLETYNNWVEAWQKFDKDVVKEKVEKFKRYEEEAKWIESTLIGLEKEINNLKNLDDLQRQNEELQRRNQELQRRNEELQRTQREELLKEDNPQGNSNQENPNTDTWEDRTSAETSITPTITPAETPTRLEEPINQPTQPDSNGKRSYDNLTDEENRVKEKLQNYIR